MYKLFFFIGFCCLAQLSSTIQLSAQYTDLTGIWSLTIDRQLDGTASGNFGCAQMGLELREDGNYDGVYLNCNYPTVSFLAEVFTASRGQAVQITLDNVANGYYGLWSGHLHWQSGQPIIEGVWTDVDGQKGDFRMVKTN